MLRRSRWVVACGVLGIACLGPAPADASPPSAPAATAGVRVVAGTTAGAAGSRSTWAERRLRRRAREAQFRSLSLVRAGIGAAGFGVWGLGLWLRRRGRGDAAAGLRQAVLVGVAVCAFPAYYNFFQLSHPGGFKGADVFHYYLGSRYFAEVGYFDLYPCTLAALVEEGMQDPDELPAVRDQHSLRLQSGDATREEMARCPDRFTAERWQAFRRDVAFLRPRVLGGSWTHLLEDHGYNPSPVWSFVGGLVSRTVPAGPGSLAALVTIDRVLVVAMGLLVAWAFGLEAACLAAIVWGTSPLWSYNWTGDAYLRNLWLFAAVSGLCLLERGRQLSAGLLLATAGLLRLFPAIFALGPLLQAAVRLPREGLPGDARRFAAGLAVAGIALLAAGAFGTGRGPAAYLEFREKMSAVVAQPGVNKVGLSALVSETVDRASTLEVTTPDGRTLEVPDPAPWTVAGLRALQALIVAAGLVAYLRALSRTTRSEAALLGFALIPLLTSPANYYYVFSVCAALLAAARPWVGVALGLALLGWVVGDQLWFLSETRYLAWDVVAVALSLAVLCGMALGPPRAAPTAAPARSTTA